MSLRIIIAGLALGGGLIISSLVVAADGITINITSSSLKASVSDPRTNNMRLRVAGPDDFSVQKQSQDGTITWTPSYLTDGHYRFDVYATQPADGSAPVQNQGRPLNYRAGGSFTVDGGQMQNDRPSMKPSSSSSWGNRLIGTVLDWLVHPAHAASSEQDAITIFGADGGALFFDHTVTGQEDWALFGFQDSISIVDNISPTGVRFPIIIGNNAPDGSLQTGQSGDVSLSNFQFYFDKNAFGTGFGGLGIGTTLPRAEIELAGPIPAIGFANTQTDDIVFIGHEVIDGTGPDTGSYWGAKTAQSGDAIPQDLVRPFGVSINAPADSFIIGPEGDVGLGTDVPNRKLTVFEDVAGEAQPLRLTNPSGKVRFLITANGQTWTFDNTGAESFTIARAGTGVAEMQLTSAGNMTITGTLTEGSSRAIKQDIKSIEPDKVLAKLEALPLSEWSYKNGRPSRHLGPMAEDFYAAFGLGPDAKHIAPKDLAGVAMASAQALKAKVDSQSETIQSQQAKLHTQQAELTAIKRQLAQLQSRLPQPVALSD